MTVNGTEHAGARRPETPLRGALANRHAHILLAEDGDDMRSLIRRALQRDGHRVTECSTGKELLYSFAPLLLRNQPVDFDLVISDVRMPGLTGLEIVAGVSNNSQAPAFILITAFGNDEVRAQAREFGAVAVIDKPFELEILTACVRRCLAHEGSRS